MHPNDSTAFVIGFKDHPRIVEPNIGNRTACCPIEGNLRPIGLIPIRATVEKDVILTDFCHF